MTSTTVQMATETTVVQVVDGEATVVQTGVPVTVTTTGGGGVTDATYVTLSTNGTLTDERVLTAGTGITLTDAGAGSTVTVAVRSASDTQTGIVELATAAETTTGTDATRAVTPDGLAGSEFGVEVVGIMASDMTTAITTGDGKAGFMVPTKLNGWNLIRANAGLLGAQSTSGLPTVQIRRVRSGSAADMLTTKITIDANESTSHTAATPPVIDTSNDDVQTGDLIYVDVDVAGTGAKGLIVNLSFQAP